MDGKLETYRTMETTSKSQLDLILQVYDGAIASFKSAAEHYRTEENQSGYDQLERAKRFLSHLYMTLDFNQGGEIAEQLGKLYVFLINQTNLIQATKDLSLIDDNVHIIENIRLGWLGLKEQKNQNQSGVLSTQLSQGSIKVNESA